MLDLGTLKIGVTVDDGEAVSKLGGLSSKASESSSKLAGLAKTAGGMAVAGLAAVSTAAVGVGVAAVKSFGDFEQSLNKVATIADLNVKSVEDIKEEVLSLSSEMGIAGEEINEAMYQAISATGDTANALSYVESAAKLAKGGFTDTASAMDAVTKTMNAYGETGEEAFTKISDLLVQTQNQGITTVNELSGALYNVVPTAAALGVSFEDVSASLATMTAQGTPTSVATTQLRSAMNELSKAGTKASEAFEQVAGKSFKEFMEAGGNMSTAMEVMEQAATKNNVSLTDMFSSVEAGAAALALTGTGAEKYNASLEAMQDSAGATDAAYQTMSDGINASFQKIVNAMKNVMIQLGDKLSPLFAEFASFIEENMPAIQNVIEKSFDVIGEVITVATDIIKSVIEWIKNFAETNSEMCEVVSEVWEAIKEVFSETIESISAFLEAFFDFSMNLWNEYGDEITTIVTVLWDVVSNLFSVAFDLINGLLKVFTAAFKGDWEGLSDALTDLIDNMWEGIKGLFRTALDGLVSIVTNIVPAMMQAGKDLINGLWEGLKSVFSSVTSWLGNKCEDIVDKVKGVFGIRSPSRVFKGIGQNLGEGLAIGLEDSMDLVENEASKMVDVINDNFGLGVGNNFEVAGASSTNNIQVTTDNSRLERLMEQVRVAIEEQPRVQQRLNRMGVV